MARSESGFQRRQSEGPTLCNLKSHFTSGSLKLVVRHNPVDQAVFQGLIRRQLVIQEPHFLCAALTYEIFKVPSAVARIKTADHRADLTKDCAFLRN
ncbi:hypothetical protein D3C86_1619340 [compost metagenome]